MKTHKTWKKAMYHAMKNKWIAILLALFAIWFVLSNLGELIVLGVILYLALKWYPNYLEKKKSGNIKNTRTPRSIVIVEHEQTNYLQDESKSQSRQIV